MCPPHDAPSLLASMRSNPKTVIAVKRTAAASNGFGFSEGKLLNSEVSWYNTGRNIDELMRKFKANLHVAKKTNEACPSRWKNEGDKTLVNPGAKMVGKVHEALKG